MRINLCDTRVTLQQALRTLRGIRQRYEMERTAHPDARSYKVHVALGDSDMFWIAATIEALEKPIAASAIEAPVGGLACVHRSPDFVKVVILLND